jgi:hypothetical protein
MKSSPGLRTSPYLSRHISARLYHAVIYVMLALWTNLGMAQLTTNGFQDFTLGAVGLENFASGARTNMGGNSLFTLYTGEDPNQSGFNILSGLQGYMIDTGATQDSNGVSDCTTWTGSTGCGLYIQFTPNDGAGGQNDYLAPGGFTQHYIESGAWSTVINRFRFRFACDTLIQAQNTILTSTYSEPANPPGGSLYVGTYIKPTTDSNPENQGQHYYHTIGGGVYPGHWTFVELNQHPNHEVGGATDADLPNDPEWVDPSQGAPVHYYDGMTRWYIATTSGVRVGYAGGLTAGSGGAWSGVTCAFKDYWFDTDTSLSPDDYVSNITANYNGALSRYELTWNGQQVQNTTYNVYYSTSSMKATSISSGTLAGTATSPGTGYPGETDVAIAVSVPYNTSGLYFAIQPQSGSGSTLCSYPCFTQIFVPGFDDATNCDLNGDGIVDIMDVELAIYEGLPEIQFYIDAALGLGCQ